MAHQSRAYPVGEKRLAFCAMGGNGRQRRVVGKRMDLGGGRFASGRARTSLYWYCLYRAWARRHP